MKRGKGRSLTLCDDTLRIRRRPGQLFLILNKSTAVQYFGIFPVCAGLYSMVPVITVWGTENYRGHVQRAIACTLIISIGQ